MSVAISNRLARRGSAVLAAGLLFGVVPGVVGTIASAEAAIPTTTTVSPAASSLEEEGATKIWTVAVSPDSSGSQVKVRLQRLVSGTWFDLFTSTDTLPSGSSYGFAWQGPNGSTLRLGATFLGDGTHAASQSNWSQATWKGKQTDIPAVKVSYAAAGGTKSGIYRSYKAGSTVRFTQTVSPKKAGKKANAHFDKLVGKKWVRVSNVTKTLSAASTAVYTFKGAAGTSYRSYSDYLGDANNQRAGSPYAYVKFGKKSTTILKQSVTPTKASGGYFIYKAGKVVNYAVKVFPNKKGQKVTGVAQHFKGGKWVFDSKGVLTLNANSAASVNLQPQPAGVRVRVSASYAGNASSAAAKTGWIYFRYVK